MKGSYKQLLRALEPLGDLKQSGYQQVTYNCPNCEKNGAPLDKFNLSVSYSKNVFHCWACHQRGPLSAIIEKYGYPEFKYLFEEIKEKEENEKHNSILEMPKYSISPLKDRNVYNYLISRGLTKKQIKERGIKYCVAGEYKDEILFPSYNSQGRLTFICTQNSKNKKYKNRKGEGHICFWENFIDKRTPIIITEGVYDALSVPNAIPLLGTSISKELLLFLTGTNVIIAMDSVIDKKTLEYLVKELESVCTVQIYNFKIQKDLNDMFLNYKSILVNNLKNFYHKENQLA